jgi:hypothetical protein
MLGWLFGKKKRGDAPESAASGMPDKIAESMRRYELSMGLLPDQVGVPDEVAEIVRLQTAYWTYQSQEETALLACGLERLSWQKLLRLHHLHCLALAEQTSLLREIQGDDDRAAAVDAARAAARERCQRSSERLLSPASPYRRRFGMVWQYKSATQERRPPDIEGQMSNASLTHLGCLEVLRLDEAMRPSAVGFVAFDNLRTVAFGPPGLFRAARLVYEDGRPDEVVWVPLLYTFTWRTTDELCRSGRMTRSFGYMQIKGPTAGFGLGLGQHDLRAEKQDGMSVFGLGSVTEMAFPRR